MNALDTRRNDSGFTLIEVVISAALMALIVVSSYLCLNAAVSTQKLIEPRVEIIQNARVAMALITADLRGACPLSKDYDFLGTQNMVEDMEADMLDFATHNYTPRHAGEGDFCEISVYLDKDPETGQFCLWRRRNPTIAFDPLSGGSREKIATGLLGVRFEYFDGFDWYDTWGEITGVKQQTSQRVQPNLSGMPEAVRITLMLDSNPKLKPVASAEAPPLETPRLEPPLVFQTVVRINLAGAAARTAASGGEGGAPESGAGTTPGMPGGGNN